MLRCIVCPALACALIIASASDSLAQRFPYPGRPPVPSTVHPTFRPPLPVPSPAYAPTYARPNASLGFSFHSGNFGMSYQSITPYSYLYSRSIYAVPSFGTTYSAYRVILPTPNLPPYDPIYPELDPNRSSQPLNSQFPQQAPGASSAQAAGIRPQGTYSGTDAIQGELRPGMILPDGAQVLSVGPTNGSGSNTAPLNNRQPTTSSGKIKL